MLRGGLVTEQIARRTARMKRIAARERAASGRCVAAAPLACCQGGARGRACRARRRGGAFHRMGVAFPDSERSERPESKGERSEPGARKGLRSTQAAPTSRPLN